MLRTRGRVVVVCAFCVYLLVTALPAVAHDTSFVFESFPEDPTVAEFTSSFGAPRSEGRRHKGNDLMAPKMTEIYAVADGVVMSMKHSARAGWYIRIGHKGDWETWYMHLNNDHPGTDNGRAKRSQIFAEDLKVGDKVKAGQLIAYSGDSGNAEPSSPHLHFELHHHGWAVNPYEYLVEARDTDLKEMKLRQEELHAAFIKSLNVA